MKKCIKLAEEINNEIYLANSYLNISSFYSQINDHERAFGFIDKAESIAKKLNDNGIYIQCLISKYEINMNVGNKNEAINYLESAITLCEEYGSSQQNLLVSRYIGLIYLDINPEKAYKFLKKGFKHLDYMGGMCINENDKIDVYRQSIMIADCIVSLCCCVFKDYAESFKYATSVKSRALTDLLKHSSILPSDELVAESTLLKEEKKLLSIIRNIALQKEDNISWLDEQKYDLDKLYDNLNNVYNKMKLIDKQYVQLRKGVHIDINVIQDMIDPSYNDFVYLEYYIMEKKIIIYIIKKKSFYTKEINCSQTKITGLINKLYKCMKYNEENKGKKIGVETIVEISNILIKPVVVYFSKNCNIHIVPHKTLHQLPFEILFEEENIYLGLKHAISYSPSSAALIHSKGKKNNRDNTGICFGVHFEEEAKCISKEIFNNEPLLDDKATIESVYNSLKYSILHFSCHGYFNKEFPLNSGICLFNGILTANDFLSLRLNADLVVFSACQSGENLIIEGDELVGLTRAILYSGVSSVLVSMWKINPKSTYIFMMKFYNEIRKGENKSKALLLARKAVADVDYYSHPYFWGAFKLIGNWDSNECEIKENKYHNIDEFKNNFVKEFSECDNIKEFIEIIAYELSYNENERKCNDKKFNILLRISVLSYVAYMKTIISNSAKIYLVKQTFGNSEVKLILEKLAYDNKELNGEICNRYYKILIDNISKEQINNIELYTILEKLMKLLKIIGKILEIFLQDFNTSLKGKNKESYSTVIFDYMNIAEKELEKHEQENLRFNIFSEFANSISNQGKRI
ncbi:MAG: CHAT domain-containing protein [Clostridiales bacterium]